nr:hypothetical protein [Stieleria maiorica]
MIADSDLGLPAETMYRKEIDEVRNRGLRLAEIGCLADRRDAKLRFIEVFRFLSCLIAQAAVSRAYDGLIVATHPRHARFYMRQLGFRRIGEIRECPYVQGSPAVPLLFDFEERRGSAVHDFLFQQPYSPEELAPYVWDEETRAHFYAALTQLDEGGEKKLERSGVGPVFSLPVQSPTVQHFS